MAHTDGWAPPACTLPTADRPTRIAEFDDLFAHAVQVTRPTSTRLDVVLPRAVEAVSRDLARRESECCSFFDFGFESADDGVVMRIGVPAHHLGLLDAIHERIAR